MTIQGWSGLSQLVTSSACEKPILICAARQDHTVGIENCYKQIQIIPHPQESNGLNNFACHGGMFQIPSLKEISAECVPDRQCFSVALENDHVAAVMRLDTNAQIYNEFAVINKKTIHYVELVVRSRHRNFSYPFLYVNFRQLLEAGYQSVVFQIFHLLMWETDFETYPLGLDNGSSKKLHEAIGAEKRGSFQTKELEYEGARLVIRPDVYYMDLSVAVEGLAILCRESNWRLAN